MWRELKAKGWPIVSSWIYEDGPGQTEDMSELWLRCISEVRTSSAVVVYAEQGDLPLKGALVEVGAALTNRIPVYVVSEVDLGSWTKHPDVRRRRSLDEVERDLRLHEKVGDVLSEVEAQHEKLSALQEQLVHEVLAPLIVESLTKDKWAAVVGDGEVVISPYSGEESVPGETRERIAKIERAICLARQRRGLSLLLCGPNNVKTEARVSLGYGSSVSICLDTLTESSLKKAEDFAGEYEISVDLKPLMQQQKLRELEELREEQMGLMERIRALEGDKGISWKVEKVEGQEPISVTCEWRGGNYGQDDCSSKAEHRIVRLGLRPLYVCGTHAKGLRDGEFVSQLPKKLVLQASAWTGGMQIRTFTTDGLETKDIDALRRSIAKSGLLMGVEEAMSLEAALREEFLV
jgi:hypothetical protein